LTTPKVSARFPGVKPKRPQAVESSTRRKVREMTASNLTPRQIAAALGISTQAVYKHLDRIRENDVEEAS